MSNNPSSSPFEEKILGTVDNVLLRKKLRKFCALYRHMGRDSILLAALAYNCGPGVVNKSTAYRQLKRGDRNIHKSYASHCRYRGKFHRGFHTRRLTELAALFIL